MSSRRVQEAERLQTLLTSSPGGASFVRVSDGEWAYLRLRQPRLTGLPIELYERFRAACNQATYLDLCMANPENQGDTSVLELTNRFVNSDPETSSILSSWTRTYFPSCVSSRKCLFVGAEASLVQELRCEEAYRQAVEQFWPIRSDSFFLDPPDKGNNILKHLDSLKASIAMLCKREEIGTVFLSLGGAAKILAVELNRENGLTTVDWGSHLRGFAYAGARIDRSGVQALGYTPRPDFIPFYFRVDFSTWMRCLERAHPDFQDPIDLALRAQCQLRLELYSKWGDDTSGWILDPYPPKSLEKLGLVVKPDREDRARYKQFYSLYASSYRNSGLKHLMRLLKRFLTSEWEALKNRWR